VARVSPPVSAEAQLAKKHSPIVYLPELGSPCQPGGTSFAPMDVEALLGNPEVALRKLDAPLGVIYGPTAADLWDVGNNVYFQSYLDLPGKPLKPGCGYERDGLRFSASTQAVAYARITSEESTPGLILQYWLFYYFNDWNNKHEADWELIQIYFDADTPQAALESEPSQIGLSQHRSGAVAAWSDSRLALEEDRPVVYVARGSHANYFSPGIYLGRGEDGRGLGCDDASHSNRRVALESRLLPDRVRGKDDPFAWLAFKGYWGELSPGTEGSTGLVTKQTWLHPYRWQEGLQSRSISLPASGLLGQDPARAFCGVVSFGSNFVLPLYRDLPLLSLAAMSAMSFGIVASLATTRYLPARTNRLRAPRRVGQILTGAVYVYARNAFVLLTLGLIALPLGLLAASAGAGLGLSGVDPGLPYVSLGVRVASALLLHGLAFGLTTLVILAASITVVGHVERGEKTDAFSALTETIRYMPRLLLAKLLTSLAIGALCLTIAGIPLALRLAVRWSLGMHAVLLGGHSAVNALRASADLVSVSRWRAAGTLTLLTLIALAVAPVAGIVMLWFVKLLAPFQVGLITAAVYALLIPYVAVALTLLYYDLECRRDLPTE
jgi:hypothetical protein